MIRITRLAASAAVVGMLAGTIGVVGQIQEAPQAQAATVQKVRLVKAIKATAVVAENNSGYQRSKFTHWIDADRNGLDTRAEVLRQESKSRVKVYSGTVSTGRWVSYYDGRTWTRASDVDIDHLVPLAEAWGSGARSWNSDTRMRFANDLGDGRSLVAVTDSVNQSKSDKDPSQWLPRASAQCRYVKEWVAVKGRWQLSIDSSERRTLMKVAKSCGNPTITIKPAKVVKGKDSSAGSGGSTGGTATGPGAYAPVSTWKCPSVAPIKGNEPSKIYHKPGQAYYNSTTPEVCFVSDAAAKGAGYRPSSR